MAIYDSGSLQCSSFKAPRIILYLNDETQASSVCAFNSGVKDDYANSYKQNPSANCRENSLECMYFNAATNRFEFYSVDEPSPSGKGSAFLASQSGSVHDLPPGYDALLGGRRSETQSRELPRLARFLRQHA